MRSSTYLSYKKYTKFRKLIKNKTVLGFDSMGRVDMSDDWWSDREKVSFSYLFCVFFVLYLLHDCFICLHLLHDSSLTYSLFFCYIGVSWD